MPAEKAGKTFYLSLSTCVGGPLPCRRQEGGCRTMRLRRCTFRKKQLIFREEHHHETSGYQSQDLAGNSYPGRGIVIGQSADGKQAVFAYFIMGRSANSRNRVFVEEPDGIRTEAADPAKMETQPHHLPPGAADGPGAYHHQRRPDRHHPGLSGKGPPLSRPCAPGIRARRPQLDPRISGLLKAPTAAISCLSSRPPTRPVPAACARPSSTRASRAWATLSTPISRTATPSPPMRESPPLSPSKGISTPSPPACGRT